MKKSVTKDSKQWDISKLAKFLLNEADNGSVPKINADEKRAIESIKHMRNRIFHDSLCKPTQHGKVTASMINALVVLDGDQSKIDAIIEENPDKSASASSLSRLAKKKEKKRKKKKKLGRASD